MTTTSIPFVTLDEQYIEACSIGDIKVVSDLLKNSFGQISEQSFLRGAFLATMNGHSNLVPLFKDAASVEGSIYEDTVSECLDAVWYAMKKRNDSRSS